MNERIGVVGLGNMGAAIATRLAGQGCTVSGWTRRWAGADRASADWAGADWAGERGIALPASLEDLVAGTNVILLSLFDDIAVAAVLDRLMGCDLRDKLIVDTSTVNPATLKGYAERIVSAGAGVLDAPVSGWPDVVSNGKAGVFIGGAQDDVDRFMPVAGAFANRVFHVGPLGHGLAAKIVNNIMLASYWQSLREALGVGRSLGLTGDVMLDILTSGPAANGALPGKAAIILGSDSPASFTVAGITKDLEVFRAVAAQGGVETPALQAALESFMRFRDAGHGELDFATMPGAVLKEGNDVF